MKALLYPAILVLALSACGKHEDDQEHSTKARNQLELIRNTEKIGYSGGAVADKVQGGIDANDDRSKHLDQMQGWAGGESADDDSSSKDTE